MDYLLKEISINLEKGQSMKVRELIIEAINKSYGYEDIISSLLDAMDSIGVKFKRNDIFVPEVLIASRSFNMALDIISPLIETSEYKYQGKVVLGTVESDLHDIGKNIVKLLLKGCGLEVIDLGNNVTPGEFLEAIKLYKPDVLAMSSLLTTTMINMKRTIKLIDKEGYREKVKILVGGAPVTSNYARIIGADYYAVDAVCATEIVRKICSNK